MSDPRVEDLSALDRDVARAATSLARWRAKLARAPEEHAEEDPLEAVRRVAGKSTLDALRALSPTLAETPLCDALMPWVSELTLARLDHDDEVAWARAAAEPRGIFSGEPPAQVSWREAWRGLVSARNAEEGTLWLDAALASGEALSAVARPWAERRLEVARRLGHAHPWERLAVGEAASLRAAAHRLLDATEDLARAVGKDARGLPATVHAAVGREAGDGWPARLTPRWLHDVFGPALGGLRIELAPLPPALGAASFGRALYALGFAVRRAAAPGKMAFALAHEPGARAAHRLGFVFAGLTADVDWQVRALGLARRTALRQTRVLARAALLEARLHAARLLLGDEASLAPADLFRELTERLFGATLDARARGAWPPARADEAARFVALLESHAFAGGLRDQFDVDWFRNPRAWAHLRAVSAVPAREPGLSGEPAPGEEAARALKAGAEAMARALEGALA